MRRNFLLRYKCTFYISNKEIGENRQEMTSKKRQNHIIRRPCFEAREKAEEEGGQDERLVWSRSHFRRGIIPRTASWGDRGQATFCVCFPFLLLLSHKHSHLFPSLLFLSLALIKSAIRIWRSRWYSLRLKRMLDKISCPYDSIVKMKFRFSRNWNPNERSSSFFLEFICRASTTHLSCFSEVIFTVFALSQAKPVDISGSTPNSFHFISYGHTCEHSSSKCVFRGHIRSYDAF